MELLQTIFLLLDKRAVEKPHSFKILANRMFGELKSVDWISKITRSENREKEIRYCSIDTSIELHYRDDLSDFNYLIESLQKETFQEEENNKNVDQNDCNIFGEKKNRKAYRYGQCLRSSR